MTATLKRYRPLPITPAATFDLSLTVPAQVRCEQIEAAICSAAGTLLESIELVDRYTGAHVEPKHCGLTFRLTLRHPERAARAAEIVTAHAHVTRALSDGLNVRIRNL